MSGSAAHTSPAMPVLGDMRMPSAFPYRDVFLQGKPRHERYDPFRIRHPEMDPGRRAKIFAPFDALQGFDEEIASAEKAADPSSSSVSADAAQ